jgi:hypothetical protein
MKTLLATASLLAILAAPALSQDSGRQAKYRANYEKKLTSNFITDGGWVLDYDAARAKAKAEGKLIFAYFTRSYSP